MAKVTFNPVAGPQGGTGLSGAAPRVGLTGGVATAGPTRSAASFYENGMNADFGAPLPEFLDGVFGGITEAQKMDRRYKGFVDGIAGVTADQVREDQSWFTKIMGPTDYEAGVTMYDTQKRVSEMVSSWQARMPELRQMSTDQVKELLVSEMNAAQSTNPFANALLEKGMMENFAPLIAQHTKERVAWQQGQMVTKQVEAAAARNAQYQAQAVAAATLGKDHPMQRQAAESMALGLNGLFDVWSTGHLQTDESKKAFLMTSVKAAARNGQFYVLEALRGAGMFDAMSAEDQERVEKTIQTAEVTFKNRYASENDGFNKMIARASSLRSFGVGGAAMTDMMKEINQTYSAMTGSKTPYFDSDQIAQWSGEATASALRRQERFDDKQFQLNLRQMDKEEKAELEQRNTQQILSFYTQGSAGEAINLKHAERGDFDRASMGQFNEDMAAGRPEIAIGRLITNYNNLKGSYTNELLRNQLRTNLEMSMDEQVNDAFETQYQIWKGLYDGQGVDADGEFRDNAQGRAAAIAYYSPQINAKMVEYDRKRGTLGPERAYVTTFGEWVQNGRPDFRGIESGDTKKNAQAFLKGLDAQGAGWFDRMFNNGYKMSPSARNQLALAVAPYYDQLGSSGLLEEHKVKAAIQMALSEDGGRVELLGGQFASHGRNQQSLKKFLDDPDGMRANVLFATVLQDKAKAIGAKIKDDTSVDIRRLPDDNGVPQYTVQLWTDDGVENFTFTGADLIAREQKGIKDAEAARAKGVQDAKAGRTGYGFQLPQETDQQFEEYHGMTREEFDARGARNRQRIYDALPYLAMPAAAAVKDSLK